MDLDYCQVVRDSISGRRAIDDQTFDALSVLSERLEGLRRLGVDFSGITFSPAVAALARQKSPVTMS